MLDGLLATAWVLAALSALSWLGCYLRRRSQLRREARERAAEAELTELLVEQAASPQPDDTPFQNLPRWRQRVFLRVLTSLLEQIQGGGRDRLIALARAAGVREILHEALRHGRIPDRINAARVLGNFGDAPAATALAAALHDTKLGVRLAAAGALLNHPGGTLTLREFLDALRFSDRDPSLALADILFRLPAPWQHEAITMLRGGLPANWRRMLAIALGRTRTGGAFEAIASLSREDDPRLRSAAWIGLAELGDPAAHALLPQGLADRSSDVRLAACHCAKRLPAVDCVPALSRLLLTDDDWWVRYRAAQALTTLGAAGRRAILDAAARAPDRETNVGLVVLRESETEAAHAG